MPEVLNDEHTHFRITLKEGIYWSDGVEFTAEDVVYSLYVYHEYADQLERVSRIVNYVDSWEKIDDYTVEVWTVNPAYDFHTVMGVYTWGAAFVPVPKHIFEPQEPNISEFRNTNPVTLGPYVVSEFDPSGFWQLWELREDWERSAWADSGSGWLYATVRALQGLRSGGKPVRCPSCRTSTMLTPS